MKISNLMGILNGSPFSQDRLIAKTLSDYVDNINKLMENIQTTGFSNELMIEYYKIKKDLNWTLAGNPYIRHNLYSHPEYLDVFFDRWSRKSNAAQKMMAEIKG